MSKAKKRSKAKPAKKAARTSAITKRPAKAAALIDVSSLASALASCRSAADVREIRDKAIGIESYLRARGVGADGLADAAEVVVRAERRLGEFLDETPRHPGARKGPGGYQEVPPETLAKLEELGVTKRQSVLWQELAAIPLEDFEAQLREARESQRRITGSRLLRATRGDDEDDAGAEWIEAVLHEHGWSITAVQRAAVLAKRTENGEDAALELLKAIAWSQWDTEEELAREMAVLAELGEGDRVLEPSAGTGSIVRAIHAVAPEASITAVEIDPTRLERLRGLLATDVLDALYDGDFLTRDFGEERFSAGVSNTPYENGADGRFLERMMVLCDRIVALLRTNALHGEERFERVWKQCKPGGAWGLHDLIYLPTRPDFESVIADGSARSDFVIVRLDRGFRGETRVDWWVR